METLLEVTHESSPRRTPGSAQTWFMTVVLGTTFVNHPVTGEPETYAAPLGVEIHPPCAPHQQGAY